LELTGRASGAATVTPFVHVYSFKDNLVVRMALYSDVAQALRDVGVSS
jgi:hypothetical protein